MGVHFLQVAPTLALVPVIAYLVFLVASLGVIGALLEGRRRAIWFELLRLLVLGLAPLLSGQWLDGSALPLALRFACVVIGVISVIGLLLARRGVGAQHQASLAATPQR